MSTIDSPTPDCPRCGSSLPPDAPECLCPRCLAAVNLDSASLLTGAGAALPPPPIEEIAPHFPQLDILSCLGRGGMGVVYKARQKSLNRLVALKLLAPEREKDPQFSARFAHEAQALAKLSHPHIVTVHDFGQAGGFFYLLMEFVDGANLRTLLQTHKFTPEQALAIVPPLCDALQYAHDRGIVHRDIKPENLLMDKEGNVKVADFGLAKMLDADPDEKPVGTPRYMAPEQVANPAQVDNRADIYSLGVVFYEMLTGELPGRQFEAPSRKVQIDVRLDEVVLRALEKNPELRYQQASILKTQVETIAGDPGNARVSGVVSVVPTESLETTNQSGAASAGVESHARVQATAREARALSEPHFSRTAIVGACWAPLFFITFVLAFTARHVRGDDHGPAWWQILLMILLGTTGFTAPFGTTILGWVAVSQIRRSAGKIYGIWLAVFDGLFFPLLLLDALIISLPIIAWKLCEQPVFGAETATVFAILTVIAVAAAIWLDIFIIRRVWRVVNQPVNGSPMLKPTPPTEKSEVGNQKSAIAPHFSRTAIVGACGVGVVLQAIFLWNFVYGWHAKAWMAMSQVEKVGFVFADTVVLAGCLAPFITTILGWLAISQIRRSAGKLHGLWLAVFDGLLFPLLVLDMLIFFWLRHTSGFSLPYIPLVNFSLICVLILAGNALIIRRVWRAVNQPVNGSPTSQATVPAEKSEIRNRKSENAPRFSRTAIVGACLVFAPFFIGVLGPALTGPVLYSDHRMMLWVAVTQMYAFAVTVLGTILGWVAVAQIRRSAGKIYGLWLAVFDGLLFPLLALDYGIAWFLDELGIAFHFWTHNYDPISNAVLTVCSISVWLVVDWLIIRRVWRAVNQPLGAPKPESGQLNPSTTQDIFRQPFEHVYGPRNPSHFWRWILIIFFAVALFVAVQFGIAYTTAKHADSSQRWQQIKHGMSRESVHSKLGEPDAQHQANPPFETVEIWKEKTWFGAAALDLTFDSTGHVVGIGNESVTWPGNMFVGMPADSSPIPYLLLFFGIPAVVLAAIFVILSRIWRAVNASSEGVAPDSEANKSTAVSSEARSGKRSWFTSPLSSPEVQEIAAHMTPSEKREIMWLGGMFGIWNAATWFAPLWILFFMAKPFNNWKLAVVAWAIGIVFYPAWFKMMWKAACSTEWAREQGIKPESLKKYSFAPKNLWKMAAFLSVFILFAVGMELVITKLMGVTQLLESAKAVTAQQQARGALQVTLGDHLGRLLAEKQIIYSHLTFEPAPSLQRITIHFDGLKAASTEAVGQWHPITGDITLDFHPPNQWHYSGSGDLSALSGIISTATPGFPWPSPTTRASAASLNSAEFHYRVFEADAALVDKLIPPASRFTISAPSDEFTISLGGVAYADAQAAPISHETLDSLLAGLPDKPELIAGQSREVGSDTTGRRPVSGTIGVLEDQTREVGSEWWHPGMADGWSYSSSDLNGLTGSGNGMGFLGFRHVHGTDEVRIAYHVDHSLDLSGHDSVNLHSKLFYQGTIPASRTLAFLVPFSRSDHSAHYLVVVFEIGNSTKQAEPAAATQNLSFGPVMERNLPFEQATIGTQYINFKSGEVFSPSPDADAHDKKAFQNWLDQRNPDALADDLTFGPTLSSYEMGCGYLAVPDGGWDTIKAADIANDLASAHLEQTAAPQDTNSLPATFLFKTRDGAEGILQIIDYANNPRGVNFRYKLVQNSTASPAPTPIPAAAQNLSFGPVMERTIERGSSPHRALNLATGEFMLPSRERKFVFLPDGADTLRVAGVDVYSSDDARAADNLNSLDMRYIAGIYPQNGDKAINIDDINAEEFSGLLAKGQYFQTMLEKSGMFGGYRFDLSKVEPVLRGTNVYLFITRDGAQGMLQISGVSENPPGVKIRYKLVQNEANVPEPIAVTIEAELKFLEVPTVLPLDLEKFDLAAVEKLPGVNLLSAPRATTGSGRECEIAVVRGATKDAFAPTPTGVTVRLRPTLDGDTVHYAAKFTISTRPAPGDAARTATQELAHSGYAPLNKPVVFELGTGENNHHLLAWMVFHRVTPPSATSSPATATPQR